MGLNNVHEFDFGLVMQFDLFSHFRLEVTSWKGGRISEEAHQNQRIGSEKKRRADSSGAGSIVLVEPNQTESDFQVLSNGLIALLRVDSKSS